MGRQGKDGTFPGLSDEEAIEGYFRNLLGHSSGGEGLLEETDYPPLDIFETEEGFIVEAEVPGVRMEDLEVSMVTGMLVIAGIKREASRGRINFLCMERTFGSFRRIVPLLRPVDTGRTTAVYDGGILRVEVPKITEKRGTRKLVPVKKA